MSGWSDVIAAVGGAAGGANHAMEFQANSEHKKALEELKAMIAQMNETGRNDRATQTDTTRQRGQDLTKDQRDADRAARSDALIKNLGSREMIASMNDATRNRLGDQTDATRNKGLDQNYDIYWNGTNPMQWDSHAISRANNERTTSTSRANALTAAATSAGNAATAAGTADKGRRSRAVIEALKMRQKAAGSLSGDDTEWADEYDRLYNDPQALNDERLSNLEHSAAAAVPVAPRGPSAAPPAPAPAPVAPRAAAPAAATPAVKLPPGLVVGARVTLRSGQRVIVTRVNPDGTFEHTPQQ